MNIKCLNQFTVDAVGEIMPNASKTNIKRYWPVLIMALDEVQLFDEDMALMTLGTVAAEVGNFDITIREYVSRYNTTALGRANSHFFDKYDDRGDLGNQGKPDGFDYRGGGAIQLTGRFNYREQGRKMGLPLEEQPELISHPVVSARALAGFLKDKENQIREALARQDLRQARKLVNGGSHGLDRFQETIYRGARYIGKS